MDTPRKLNTFSTFFFISQMLARGFDQLEMVPAAGAGLVRW